ncbi:MAG: DHA2 family efflux MFS transporter permease subunit, partial [Solirubrobacterales bacterium]|nr:DHA2 family efflux MFS transporter permease subunit [Solirubrobacterales bacterium]
DASASELQWIVDSYMLVFAAVLLTAGALGDRFGRKKALTFGLLVFALGSGLSALADSSGMLIATRALMGAGGAFIMPSTLSILTAVFPAHERGKAIGIWAAVSGLGIVIGPVTGGWLVEHGDWSLVFLVNLPFVAAALLSGRWLVPESLDPAKPRLDGTGFALSSLGLGALVWAIIEAPARGWADGLILVAFAVAAVALGALIAWELRVREPMLDVRLFRNRRFSAASGAIAVAFFALFGTIFFLTQYLQSVLGYGAFESGLRVMPVAAGVVLGGPLSAKLVEHVGTKRVVGAGLALVAVGLTMLSGAEVGGGYGIVAAVLLVLGLGMGLTMAPATESVMGSLPLAKASVGSAVNDATRTMGGALGVAVLGSLLSSGYRAGMEGATQGLPAGAAETANQSLAGALAVAQRLGGGAGGRVSEAAQQAFVDGMHTAVLAGAAVAAAGALLTLLALPARAPLAEPAPA